MNKQVIVVGSYVADLMGRAPHLPIPGETVKGKYFKIGPGGKGFNQCIAAKQAGADVKFISKIGKDNFGELAISYLKEKNIVADSVIISDTEPSGVALIVVDDQTSQNLIAVFPGACDTISPDEVKNMVPDLLMADIVVLQSEINLPALKQIIDICKHHRKDVIYNPAPYQFIEDSYFDGLFLICPNESEASLLTGVSIHSVEDAIEAAKILAKKNVQHVIITLGGNGAVYYKDEAATHFLPYKVNVLDTTGAGDAFVGSLAAALSQNDSLIEAIKFANAAAALSVQKIGTSVAMPDLNEIRMFMDSNYAEILRVD